MAILDQLNQIIDNDICMIYGETGSLKTKAVKQIALEAARAGKKVKFIDTERNLSKKDITEIEKAGKYIYNPTWDGLEKEISQIGKFDLLVVDSIGMPALKHYACMRMNQKGGAMLDMIGLLGKIKDWCYSNNAVAFVTNQNQSTMAAAGKSPDYILRPFGDKAQYVCKEIWRTVLISSKPDKTLSTLFAYRSRDLGRSTPIADIEVTNQGTAIKIRLEQRGLSSEVLSDLLSQIESAATIFELDEVSRTIKSLTNEMLPLQRQELAKAWQVKKNSLEDAEARQERSVSVTEEMPQGEPINDPELEAQLAEAEQQGLI